MRSNLVVALLLVAGAARANPDMAGTKHNLSASGPGTVHALNENRICVFCHTPHDATPLSPLWNKELQAQTYTVYTSPTLGAGPLPQPSGPTKLCLSCHDGTIAMGAVLNPVGGIGMASDTLPAGLSDFGLDLSAHHPVGFAYSASLPNPELAGTPPADLVFGGADEVHCTTCHDPHDDQYGRFLAKDNRYSALCTSCHQLSGWATSAHATSTASVVGVLPIAPKTWPTYTQLDEWGCEACHTPHFANTAEHLLNYTVAPADAACSAGGCHTTGPPFHKAGGAVPLPAERVDIPRQLRKPSGHQHGVTCVACHNPHTVNDWGAKAPFVSGRLQGASGVDRNGARIPAVRYEYEVCFKCHADDAPDVSVVPRVIEVTNTRRAFDPTNASFHPVVAAGRALAVPSIPSTLMPGLRPTEMIYCTSCHADDEGGSNGPHGSVFPPILKRRYETADGTPEGYESYALCYQCHERTSILSDASFRRKTVATSSGGGHSGHLRAGASCSACHDPHGVAAEARGVTGSHTHLVNFDTRAVAPRPGQRYPVFRDQGASAGSCDLVCHGVTHDDAAYP